ncbi:MAG: hypothetical protein NTV73_14440 [Hyphomicrobiales bacterium]|nr:hypothetical protein [Hyphomicrobiales bacterium]
MNSISLRAVLLSVAGLACTAPAIAADMVEPAAEPIIDSGWTFSATPYFWMAGIKGQIGVRGLQPASVDLSFSDVFNAIDWSPPPVMFTGEARNGRYGLYTDFLYLGTGGGGTLSGPLGVAVDVGINNIIWSFGGSYRVLDNGTATVDLMAGGRLWYMDTDIALAGPVHTLQGSGSKTWVDPIIGVAAAVDLGNGFGLKGTADVGGFGAAADLDWQVVGALQYQYNQTVSFELGYRYLDVDYSKDGFVFDIAMQGPIVGATFKF